jgi:hypothetical protein
MKWEKATSPTGKASIAPWQIELLLRVHMRSLADKTQKFRAITRA